MKYAELASAERVEKTRAALRKNGIETYFVQTAEEAKAKILELIPAHAEVMNMTSVTAETIGLTREILETDRFGSVRKKWATMDQTAGRQEMKRMGVGPEYAVGSIQAITEDGKIIVASDTGSQLPAYAYGAGKVIWVAGTQKLVKDLEDGMKRIYDYVLPLEAQRARKAYGAPGSNVSKLLIINKEIEPGRLTLVLVNQVLGF